MIVAVAGLAQLVEHLIRNEGVVGSSPITGTTKNYYRAPKSARLKIFSLGRGIISIDTKRTMSLRA